MLGAAPLVIFGRSIRSSGRWFHRFIRTGLPPFRGGAETVVSSTTVAARKRSAYSWCLTLASMSDYTPTKRPLCERR